MSGLEILTRSFFAISLADISTKKSHAQGRGNHKWAAGSKSLNPQWLDDCNIPKKKDQIRVPKKLQALFGIFHQPVSKCGRFPDSSRLLPLEKKISPGVTSSFAPYWTGAPRCLYYGMKGPWNHVPKRPKHHLLKCQPLRLEEVGPTTWVW